MWADITTTSKVRLVWSELEMRTEAHAPQFKLEINVVRLDNAKLSGHLYVRTVRFVSEDRLERFIRAKHHDLFEPAVSCPPGDEASVTRHFAAWAEDFIRVVSHSCLQFKPSKP